MAVGLTSLSMPAQTAGNAAGCRAQQFTERLWRNATKGDLLSRTGWQRNAGFFLHPEPWPQNTLIHVVSNHWKMVSCTTRGNTAEVTVAFSDVGQIDDVLGYRVKDPATQVQKQYRFILAPTHWHTYKPDGSIDKEMTGPTDWQIEDAPDAPWTVVNTAIRYVFEMSQKTRDPSIRGHADQTLAELLSVKERDQTDGAGETPVEAIQRLWTSGTNGELLTDDGRLNVAHLFAHYNPVLKHETIQIVDNDWALHESNSTITGEKAVVTVGYADAGELDSMLRYIPAKPTPFFKTAVQYSLVLTSADSGNSNKYRTKGISSPSIWRIEASSDDVFPNIPWTTVNTAIRYVLEMRSKTTDPILRKNADRTLTALLRYR